MFTRLKVLYDAGKLTEAQIEMAVTKGYITQEQANEIIGVTAP